MSGFENKLFSWLWRLVSGRPRAIVGIGLVLAVASGLASARWLTLDANQDSLVSPEVPFHKRYLRNIQNFGDQEYLFVVIKTGGSEEGQAKARDFADAMAARLSARPDLVRAIHYRLGPADLGQGALLFAKLPEVESLSRMVQALAPAVDDWLARPDLPTFLTSSAQLMSGGGGGLATAGPELLAPALSAMDGFLAAMSESFGSGRAPDKPLIDLAAAGEQYFFADQGRLLVMRVLPAKDYGKLDVVGPSLAFVRQCLAETRAEHPELQAGLTGRPALQADEMETTNADMTRASIGAFLLVGTLYVFVLHGLLRAGFVNLTLMAAMAWTFGFALVAVGSLNLLSIVFALVLVGIGGDYGSHLVLRYVEETERGGCVTDCVKAALMHTGPGVLTGALTSVCAFYAVLGSDFIGLAQLGLIGGTGILLCVAAMLTMLPALLLLAGRRRLFPGNLPRLGSMPLLERLTSRPAILIQLMIVASLAALPWLFKVRFNYNLLELQASGLESVAYENVLVKAADESTWFAILSADSLDHVGELTERLEKMPSVGRIESILDFLPDRQAEKAALLNPAGERLAAVPPLDATVRTIDPAALSVALAQMTEALEGLSEKLFAAGAGAEVVRVEAALKHLSDISSRLVEDPASAARLTPFQAALQQDLFAALTRLKTWLAAREVDPQNLPPAIRDLYVGADGSYQLKVSPRGNVWDFELLGHFVADLRSVDPEVSGVPVGVYESSLLMHRTFLSAALLTVLLVAAILWLECRSIFQVGLTLLPLGAGILWLLELMGLFGVDFNLANFFAIPILIALGVDGGVHFLHRARELKGGYGLFLTSTPTAVALSFATTMIGFGGLLFAHHRGLASLGWVMVLGSGTCLAACLLVLPAVLKWIKYR
jgi:hopanoid biosynthesis associated RND transporter like protein HpnN